MSQIKKCITAIMAVVIMFITIPVNCVFAEDRTILSVGSAEGYPGNYVSVDVNLQNAVNLGGLSFGIYYDSDNFELNSVNTYDALFSDSTFIDINKNISGQIGQIMVSIVDINGINAENSSSILSLQFHIKSDVVSGQYPINLSYDEAYDTNFNNIQVNKSEGKITVKESNPSQLNTVNFYCNMSSDGEITKDTNVIYKLYIQNPYKLAGGNFFFTYDPDVLQFVELSVNEAYKSNNAIASLNTNTRGLIKYSYADIQSITDDTDSNFNFINVAFRVKTDAISSTSVGFYCESLLDENLNILLGSTCSCEMTISKKKAEMFFSWDGESADDRTFDVQLLLSADSNLGAGDFEISYDTDELECKAVGINNSCTSDGAIVITREAISNGKIYFSYVNVDGSSSEETILDITFQPIHGVLGSTIISLTGKNVVDSSLNNLDIDYKELKMDMPEGKGEYDESGHQWSFTSYKSDVNKVDKDHYWGTAIYTCDICGETKEVEELVPGRCQLSATLSLSDEIIINFYVKYLAEGTNASDYTISYSFDGSDTIKAVSEGEENNGSYKFRVAFCPAMKMIDGVVCSVKYKGAQLSSTNGYSIQTYCRNKINAARNSTNPSSDTLKLASLSEATLDYGAYAQLYFDYKTNNLANSEGYTAGTKAISEVFIPDIYKPVVVKGDSVTSVGASLNLTARTEVNVYFYGGNINDNATVYTNGGSKDYVTLTKTEQAGKVLVTVGNIPAKYLNDTYTIALGNSSVTYSPMTYLQKHQNDAGDDGLLFKALYRYYQAAEEYFAESNN